MVAMADITWSAYALAMFTEEQRNAAAGAGTYVPDEPRRPIPPPLPAAPSLAQGAIVDGLNANIPSELAQLMARGWRYENGSWTKIPVGYPGTAVVPPGDPAPGGRVGMATVFTQAVIQGASVLGVTVPNAPPVLLPSFVGGRLGRVEIAGGMRPESGGQERVIIGGVNAAARMPEVRF